MSALVGMPAQYEMLVSHSPPVFSHSPPASFLNEYAANNRLYDPTRSLFRSSHHLSAVRGAAPPKNQNLAPIVRTPKKMPTSPIRSCLVVKTATVCYSQTDEDNHADQHNNTARTTSTTDTVNIQQQPPSDVDTVDSAQNAADKATITTPAALSRSAAQVPKRTKKRVVFADDQGYSLTETRIMSEPSSVPPTWSLEFLAHVTQGMVSPVPVEQWTVSFRQPASDYLDFRRTLDSKNVSLENVIVKENDSCVVGTVKVRNLSFHKEVIVRTSSDGWKTQEDTFCTYSTIGGTSGGYVLYDTFSFKLTLPPVSRKLEFCVCFRSDGTEYWDNNNNENYIINKRSTGCGSADVAAMPNGRAAKETTTTNNTIISSPPLTIPNNKQQNMYGDSQQSKLQNPWSDYASWTYDTAGPYW